MKQKYKNQSKYESIIREDNCDKLIRQVKSDRLDSEDSCIQTILALSSILEDEDMKENVSRGLFVPAIGTLIRESAESIKKTLITVDNAL